MKTIVLIIDSLVTGGAETTNARLGSMFIETGYNVHIIVLKNTQEIELHPKIVVHTLNFKKSKLLFNNYYFSKKLKDKLYSIKEKNLILGSLGLSHKLMNHIDSYFNFYYVLHGTTTKAKLETKKGIRKIIKKRELVNLYNNKNIITVSNGVKEDILTLNISPKSIQTIYNPFNFEEIKELSKESTKIDLPPKYIVHVGRFAKVKRHDILLKAFAKIKDKELKLILVGDGEEKKNILTLIKELKLTNDVILLGFIKNPYPIIKKAELLVLSSENEGFGNVLIEAQILKTMIVSTKTTGANEIMKDQLSNYLSEVNNIEDLANNITIAIKNKISINLSNYDKKTILSKYKKLISLIY